MHAFLLAGGKGVRLRPYTTTLPKPLVPIGDQYSILEIVLMQLADQGFTRVTLSIGHLGHLIRSYVGDGRRWGLEVDYVTEEFPLGTMGPVVSSLDGLPEHFVVMNGDVLTNLNFADLLLGHINSPAPLTIATYNRDVKIDFGVLRSDGGTVTGFEEKPSLDYQVSMGVYGLSRTTLERYVPGRPFGFDDLVLDLLKRGQPPTIFPFGGYWLDIGRPEDYDRANLDFATMGPELVPGRAATVVASEPPGLLHAPRSAARRVPA